MFTTTRAGAALLAAVLLSTAACAASASSEPTTLPTAVSPATIPTTVPTRPTQTIDQLVTVDAGRLRVRCAGEGDATVLLIAGLGDGGETWVAVEPSLMEHARVCSYAHLGTGTSDLPSSEQTFTMRAEILHSLLNEIGEPGPYVVAGHSFGGAEAVAFASMFPDDVASLVLIDASPVTWPAAMCDVPDDGTPAAQMLVSFCFMLSDPNALSERLDVHAAFAEVAAIRSLGALPMTVITASTHANPGLAASEDAQLNNVWNTGQQQWSALSSAARLESVDNTGHVIQLDQPKVVIDAIVRLLP